jgi:NodT family efflux transporter outer membrane factor (OMF) lipoprotein
LSLVGLSLTALGMALASCAPNLGPEKKLSLPQDYASARSLAAPAVDWPEETWWTVYNDPELTDLIEQALRGSPDLRTAQARVREAEAQATQAGARLLPSLSASGSVKETKIEQSLALPPQAESEISNAIPSGWNPTAQLAANLNWQLDFFGRNRAALAAATSQADAARADEASARLQIATGVASAYADLLRLYADRDAAAEALKVRRQTLDLIGQRLRNGLETRGGFSQQNATLPQAQGDLDRLDLQILQARHQLAALLGQGPDAGLDVPRPTNIALRPLGLPATVSADLIGRRPDIAAARLRAEAARQQIKSARADFYPSVNLAGSYTVLSLKASDLFKHNIQLTQVGPAISLPLFDGGQRVGASKGARAQYDEAVADYDKTLANALREVADGIAAQRSLASQLADAKASLASGEEAYSIAKQRYQGGLSPYLDVLTAENSVLSERRTLADLDAQALSLDVTLIRALGGGFVAGAPNQTPSR